MSFYSLSNLDIKMTYIANENREDTSWLSDIFVQTKFFAESRAKKYRNGVYDEDLTQEARLGLWEAIITYDYQKNFDFFRWAQWNISKKFRSYTSEFKKNNVAKCAIKKEVDNHSGSCGQGEEEVLLEMKITVDKLLFGKCEILSDREAKVVLDNLVLKRGLQEVAQDLNLSAERVRQIRNASLSKLRGALS